MPWTFNPFSGTFDQKGSGGGGSVLEGEVATFADLPQTAGTPPVGSSYLVRESTGVWLVNRRQAGIYIRTNNTGVRADDWSYGGDFPVQSVNGETGAVTLDAADVGALQSQYSIETFIYSALSTATLPARRNARWTVDFIVSGGTRTLNLPSTNVLVGDRIHVALTAPAGTTVIVIKPQPGSPLTLATLSGGSRFVFGAEVTQIVGGTPVWQSLGELQASVGAIPATSSAVGTIGSFVFAEQFMYVCIAPDTWRRVPVAAF
jgi:hypothetical protein